MDQLSPVAAGPLTVRKGGGGVGGGGVAQAGEPLMTASTNLEHMELSIARDTTSLANTAHVSHAGGQKMFAFKSARQKKKSKQTGPRLLNSLVPLGRWILQRGELRSETNVKVPVCDGWITEKAEAGDREFGDKSRVMASPPHLRESRLSSSYGKKKQCLFSS